MSASLGAYWLWGMVVEEDDRARKKDILERARRRRGGFGQGMTCKRSRRNAFTTRRFAQDRLSRDAIVSFTMKPSRDGNNGYNGN
jgi:hypothetical protein